MAAPPRFRFAFIVVTLFLLIGLLGLALSRENGTPLAVNVTTAISATSVIAILLRTHRQANRLDNEELNQQVDSLRSLSRRLVNASTLTEADLLILQIHYSDLVVLVRPDFHLLNRSRRRSEGPGFANFIA